MREITVVGCALVQGRVIAQVMQTSRIFEEEEFLNLVLIPEINYARDPIQTFHTGGIRALPRGAQAFLQQ